MHIEKFFLRLKIANEDYFGEMISSFEKMQGNNRNLTAGCLRQEGVLERLVQGYNFLRALCGSLPYFEQAKKDIFAMIRQLRPATLSCSFSSAETNWIISLEYLASLLMIKDIQILN